MSAISYDINKGINRPIEFRGLKAQYIYYLAIGLAVLLVVFSILYIAGVPVYLCLPVVLVAGSGLFMGVYRYSHRYGEYGLMKAIARRQVPSAIISRSGKWASLIRSGSEQGKVKSNDHHHDTGRGHTGSGTTSK